MRMVNIFILALLVTTGSGCEKDTQETCDSLSKKGSTDSADLIGAWKFENFKRIGYLLSKEKPPKDIQEMTIEFTDSFLFLLGSVNKCSAKYTLKDENHLSIPPFLCTEKSGPGIEWEERLNNALQAAQCYTIKGEEELRIYFENEDKKNLIIFR